MLFGDGLHQIHPLAGQGFNMTIRDLKILIKIINERHENGLELDSSCFRSFEDLAKPKNLIFSESINLIHNIFRTKNNFGRENFY